MQGKFENDSMFLPLQVFGVSEKLQQPITALIDTGYAGYLTLPFSQAFPVGLVLRGQQSYTLADGSLSSHFVCVGTVIFEGTSIVVPIDVQNGGPILAGMQLFKKLQLRALIDFSKETFEIERGNSLRLRPLPNIKINI